MALEPNSAPWTPREASPSRPAHSPRVRALIAWLAVRQREEWDRAGATNTEPA
ncbi:MAG: hypothetical protein M5U18_02510 [Dehalococcoidia bacterium]|nr:hypothetical protein [Dehalococcoidia bacterium]